MGKFLKYYYFDFIILSVFFFKLGFLTSLFVFWKLFVEVKCTGRHMHRCYSWMNFTKWTLKFYFVYNLSCKLMLKQDHKCDIWNSIQWNQILTISCHLTRFLLRDFGWEWHNSVHNSFCSLLNTSFWSLQLTNISMYLILIISHNNFMRDK